MDFIDTHTTKATPVGIGSRSLLRRSRPAPHFPRPSATDAVCGIVHQSRPPAPRVHCDGGGLNSAGACGPCLPARRARRGARARSRGLTLLEVLVSLFLLSIMTLGISALQEITLRFAINSDHRAHAERLIDEMTQFYSAYTRRNAQVSLLNRFIIDDTSTSFSGSCDSTTIATSTGASVNAVLTDFLNCWRVTVRDTLPGGRAQISFVDDPADNPTILVEIHWGAGGPGSRISALGG